MSKSATLVIMAAGMGSRFGGLKQIEPLGPCGEIILDYSVYDAVRAGFDKVVFLIKKEIEEDFRAITDGRYDSKIKVEYAFQELSNLPEGFAVPEGRVKPWGTAHAIYSCKDVIDGPFAVINADDYYGAQTFKVIYDELTKEKEISDVYDFSMVGFKLENTLTENGHVARGVCKIENGYMTDITERTKIMYRDGKIMFTEDGESWEEIHKGTPVSMNLWGFTPEIITEIEDRFAAFLRKNLDTNPLRCEYYIPFVVDELVKEGKARVTALTTPERWYGVTYKEDKQSVTDALSKKHNEGLYPTPLWK
ncbi:MAG: nucleotidyltransferase [Clostridia bacterium]|nr:nucleotidyltransferase [Clostridia bacterium]